MTAMKIAQRAARSLFFSSTLIITNKAAGVENDLGVRYSSMMYSAVPAIGIVSKDAISATPPHFANGSRKQSRPKCQQASRRRKMERKCQTNRAHSKGTWVMRIEPAIKLGKRVRCACDVKKAALNG